jgi:excisionase family DNA binding protein
MGEYLNTKQAAELAGVSPRTVIEWVHAGRLKASRNPSIRGRFKILKEDLQAAMTYTPSVDG